MRSIDRKVLRDLWMSRAQLLAIALVLACGVGLFLGMRSTLLSLERARASYYASERFADVFARCKRAPTGVVRRLRAIPGVQRLQERVVADVTLDLPDVREAVTGRLISLPDHGTPAVNGVVLRSGRLPRPGSPEEVVVNEAFAEGHELALGTRVAAIINGRREELKVVGTVLSPEFTITMGPGQIAPDDRLFGVFWMRRAALGPAFDMEGAFNDVAIQVARDASPRAVILHVDALLDRYGGTGAIRQADQTSASFLNSDLAQLRSFATMMPVLFLAVGAFLLNIVLGRIVAGQREEIAALKALGHHDLEVGLHYGKLVSLVVAAGIAIGVGLAAVLGSLMTQLYSIYYRFPGLPFELGMQETFQAVSVSLVAAALGTFAALRRVVLLPPAEALRPEAPAVYRATLVERLGLADLLPPAARLVLRELERKPGRALLSVTGIGMATGLVVVSTFTYDAVNYLMMVQFGLSQREDVSLSLAEPRELGALHELTHLPGVLHAEPYRAVPVRLRAGPLVRNAAITGLSPDATLQAVLDADLNTIAVPEDGLLLSRKLAEILAVDAGDTVRMEVLEGERPVIEVPVARITETYVGVTAFASLDSLSRMLGETPTLNGAWLTIDEHALDALHSAVKETPSIAGITSRLDALASLKTLLDENVGTSIAISLAFSLVMALGVLYNAARITLAERARELASLRVLGFREREVAAILLGEMALLVATAIPLGLLMGRLLAAQLTSSEGFDTDQFRLPLVIFPATHALAAVTILVAAALSSWSAVRRLRAIPIVDVLKARD